MALFSKKDLSAAYPACTLTRDGHSMTLDDHTSALLYAAWEAKRQADAAKERLDALNDQILNAYGAGCSLDIPGAVRLTLTGRESIKITDLHQMRQLLGGRFDDLVDARLEHRLSDKLKGILADADHPLCEPLRDCCAFSSSASITYRPLKP